jgi:hypothetical protein
MNEKPYKRSLICFCDTCLDTGKYYGWLDGEYILIDCPCGHLDNPVLSQEDPRWEEYNKR